MLSKVLILDDTVDTRLLAGEELKGYDDIVTLFWISPESREKLERAGHARCHSLLDVVGGLDRWERASFELTRRVCEGHPYRSIIEESLYRESLMIQAAVDAHRFCRGLVDGRRQPRIDAMVSEPLGRVLRAVSGQPDEQMEIRFLRPLGAPPSRSSIIQRLLRRLRHAWLTGGWWAQAWNLLAEADREYAWRYRIEKLRSNPDIAPEGITFFSSYLNNSRNLEVVESLMPLSVSWVVLNHYARKGAQPTDAPVHWLWRFFPRHVSQEGAVVEMEEQEEPIRSWLSWSPTWRHWVRSGRTAARRLAACWECYLETARPRLLVTAGQWGIEGWMTAEARKRGIPTLQLLHGVLAGYFHSGRAIESDAMVVWGEFWRDRFPKDEHKKIHVANPGIVTQIPRKGSTGRSPRQITYFSWPLSLSPFYNAHDFQAGMIAALREVKEATGCRILIRAHPLENVGDIVACWRHDSGSFPPDIELSQHEPLESILEQTDVALMYRSTVLLDCRLNGIPAVLPGWIDYGWGTDCERVEGVHFAESFDDIRSVLQSWISQPPLGGSPHQGFVVPPGKGVDGFGSLIDVLLRSGEAPTSP